MGKPNLYFEHPETRHKVLVYEGFSFVGFIFTFIWCINKQLYKHLIIYILIYLSGFFIGNLIYFPIFFYSIYIGSNGNKIYQNHLMKHGYVVVNKVI